MDNDFVNWVVAFAEFVGIEIALLFSAEMLMLSMTLIAYFFLICSSLIKVMETTFSLEIRQVTGF